MKISRTFNLEKKAKIGDRFNHKELIIDASDNSFTTISKGLFSIQRKIYIFDEEAWPGKCHEQIPFSNNYFRFSRAYNQLNKEYEKLTK